MCTFHQSFQACISCVKFTQHCSDAPHMEQHHPELRKHPHLLVNLIETQGLHSRVCDAALVLRPVGKHVHLAPGRCWGKCKN